MDGIACYQTVPYLSLLRGRCGTDKQRHMTRKAQATMAEARMLAWGMTHVKRAILGEFRILVTGLEADRRGI